MTAHWASRPGSSDRIRRGAAASPSRTAYRDAGHAHRHLHQSADSQTLDRVALQKHLDDIGQVDAASRRRAYRRVSASEPWPAVRRRVRSAPHSCSPPSSARASWRERLAAGTRRGAAGNTIPTGAIARRADHHPSGRSRVRTSIRRSPGIRAPQASSPRRRRPATSLRRWRAHRSECSCAHAHVRSAASSGRRCRFAAGRDQWLFARSSRPSVCSLTILGGCSCRRRRGAHGGRACTSPPPTGSPPPHLRQSGRDAIARGFTTTFSGIALR